MAEAKQNLRLASFDGGGVRCFSQLAVLESIMHRIRFDKHPNDPERVMRPHEHFDLMGGSEAGGLLVVMFVKLHLSIEEAMEEFDTIYENVYADAGLSPQDRSAKLRECLINLLQSKGMHHDAKLVSDEEQGCSGFVLVSSAVDIAKHICLRTSPIRSQISSAITVVDAVMATCASQPDFEPLSFGKGYRKQAYVAVSGASTNPTRDVLMEAQLLFGNDAKVASILSLGSGHPGPITTSAIMGSDTANQTLQTMLSRNEQRAQEMEEQLGELGIYCRLSVSQGMQSSQQDLSWVVTQTGAFLADTEVTRKVDNFIKATTRRARTRLGRPKAVYKEEPMQAVHYVRRQGPRDAIVGGITAPPGEQKIIVVSGMAGCGKTQLMTDVVKEYKLDGTKFKYVFFVDGSSQQNIDRDLVSHVRRICLDSRGLDADDARNFLCDPANAEWMLAIDNVDVLGTELSDHLPHCSHGVVLITTRNHTLGILASKPEYHVILDVMAPDEAFEVIKRCASLSSYTLDEEHALISISEKLGYLPVALSQAGYYMRETGCSGSDYLGLIRQSLRQQMERPVQNRQNDCAYAAFDVTYKRLPPAMQDLVHILSHYHFADFPLSVAASAAKKLFADDPFPLEPRGVEFDEAIGVLKRIFVSSGEWSDGTLHELVATMRKFSLASFTFTPLTKLIRQHPLSREWAYDRIPVDRQLVLRHAACRLLACCEDSNPLITYLSPHVDALISRTGINLLSLNDQAMLAHLFLFGGRSLEARTMWLKIHEVLLAEHGSESLQVAAASLELAATFDDATLENMEQYELAAVRIRKHTLGDDHLDTLDALRNLAATYTRQGRHTEANATFTSVIAQLRGKLSPNDPYMLKVNTHLAWAHRKQKQMETAEESLELNLLNETKTRLGERHLETLALMLSLSMTYYERGKLSEAANLQLKVLEERKMQLGETHKDTITAMDWLGQTYHSQTQYVEAAGLRVKVMKWRKVNLGEGHEHTILAMKCLGETYHSLGRHTDALDLRSKLLKWQKAKLGEGHADTISTMDWLAYTHHLLGQYGEAAKLRVKVLEWRREKLGENHEHTILAIGCLAETYYSMARYTEAADLRVKLVEWRRVELGEDHKDTINTMNWLAETYYLLAQYAEAADLRVKVVEWRKRNLGKDHEHTILAMKGLAETYRSLDQYAEAADLRAKVVELQKEKLGEDHEETLLAMEYLGLCYYEGADYAKADVTQTKVYTIRLQKNDNQGEIGKAAHNLASTYLELSRHEEAKQLALTAERVKRGMLGVDHDEYILTVRLLESLGIHPPYPSD